MIAYETIPAERTAAPAAKAPADPVDTIARAMLEIEAQGRIVDIEALDGFCETLTRAEILAHAEDARALAKLRKRGDA